LVFGVKIVTLESRPLSVSSLPTTLEQNAVHVRSVSFTQHDWLSAIACPLVAVEVATSPAVAAGSHGVNRRLQDMKCLFFIVVAFGVYRKPQFTIHIGKGSRRHDRRSL
jgi:hypothetical protein